MVVYCHKKTKTTTDHNSFFCWYVEYYIPDTILNQQADAIHLQCKKVRLNYTAIFLEKRNHCCSLWAGTVCISITSQGINCFSAVSRMASACWTESRSKVISQIAWEQILRLSMMVNFKMVLEDVRLLFKGALNAGNQHWADECVEDEILSGLVSCHIIYRHDYYSCERCSRNWHLCDRSFYQHWSTTLLSSHEYDIPYDHHSTMTQYSLLC